jgi:hypothetical protein
VKALVTCLVIYATASSVLPHDIVFKSSASAASLIELYSSEGCSSCPPAEEWTNDLKSAPGLWKDVFPVVFHVDYWDGLGWPDRFARPEYTQRQRDYASRLNQESVYTPEFILNGLEWHRGWLGGQEIPAQGLEKTGSLRLTVNLDTKKITAQYTMAGTVRSKELLLNVAVLGFHLITQVKAGENGGRQLRHDFVVLGFSSTPLPVEMDAAYDGSSDALQSTKTEAPGAVVAWVSETDGSILQVAGGWLTAGHS